MNDQPRYRSISDAASASNQTVDGEEIRSSSASPARQDDKDAGPPNLSPDDAVRAIADSVERNRQRKRERAIAMRRAARLEARLLPAEAKTETKSDVSVDTLVGWEALKLPSRRRSGSRVTILSFGFFVLLPVIIVAAYYGFIASNQYVSEFRFTVRDAASAAAVTASSSSSTTSLVTSLVGPASTDSTTNNYVVADYLMSRQAISDLSNRFNVTSLYSKPDVDWFARFARNGTEEQFEVYWKRMVNASYDQITGIVYAQVRAFSPDDAYLVSSNLLSLSEELVNRMANRTQRDAVRFAEDDVRRAEERLKTVRAELTRYRNAEQVIDPQSSIVTSNILLAQTLRANLSQAQTDLAALDKQKLPQDASVRQVLQSRIKATQEQLAAVEAEVANMRDGNNPLSKVVADYERLDLERQFAQNMVLSTKQSLEQAKSAELSQHLYITPFVRPAIPQSSTYPKKWVAIGITAIIGSILWIVGLMIFRSVREHQV